MLPTAVCRDRWVASQVACIIRSNRPEGEEGRVISRVISRVMSRVIK